MMSYSDVRLRRKSLEGLKAKLGVHAQTEHVQEEKAEAEENTFDHGSDLEPPDGGLRAWLVVVGIWLCERLGSLPIGRLFDLGYFHSILFISSAILIIATFCIPECKEFWHFLLCQGFATGLACGALFGPIAAVLAMWFKKRRSLALGLFATGSSLGGTVIPIAALKRRLPPSPRSNGIFNLEMFKSFKSPAFTIYCLSSFFIYLGFYTLAIANASSGVGRVLAGWCGDKFGAMNILVPFTTLAGAMTCVWPFMQSKGGLIAVVVLYGLSSGSYGALVSVPVIETLEQGDTGRDLGRRLGLAGTFLASGGLLGPPLSGLVLKARGIQAMGIYAGTISHEYIGLGRC
ncbi:hypothetical protein D9757_007767 [Collybiopsis confluens]|uniref:MFS general substrate transporter n=1 Tax=Collybiopsis confluens TaxID=2823264 RepID=A0A8H5MBE0_9AGAR|nr:hypothetical protein D9757_007767 [Collybiopsis confluens]